MDQASYNAKVQELQRMFADTRVRAVYDNEQLVSAVFEVCWDGRWRTLGVEDHPMTPAVERRWNEVLEYKMRAQFAGALITS